MVVAAFGVINTYHYTPTNSPMMYRKCVRRRCATAGMHLSVRQTALSSPPQRIERSDMYGFATTLTGLSFDDARLRPRGSLAGVRRAERLSMISPDNSPARMDRLTSLTQYIAAAELHAYAPASGYAASTASGSGSSMNCEADGLLTPDQQDAPAARTSR